MKVYISGPISGHSDAPEKFEQAKKQLLDLNKEYIPISPMDLSHKHDKSWFNYMREDIQAMMECEAIYMLNGWKKSMGARIENDLAQSLNFKIIHQL